MARLPTEAQLVSYQSFSGSWHGLSGSWSEQSCRVRNPTGRGHYVPALSRDGCLANAQHLRALLLFRGHTPHVLFAGAYYSATRRGRSTWPRPKWVRSSMEQGANSVMMCETLGHEEFLRLASGCNDPCRYVLDNSEMFEASDPTDVAPRLRVPSMLFWVQRDWKLL